MPRLKDIFQFRSLLLALTALATLTPQLAHAQASDIPSAAPPTPAGQTDTQRGQALIGQMIAALGGDAWLNRTSIEVEGRISSFFHGQPNPYVTEYHELHRFAASGQPDVDRIELGKKRDVIQIWTATAGTEITYKGNNPLPQDQVDDTLRRRAHSIEEVVHTWIRAPGVVIVAEGATMVERRLADKVTILTANNDAVTLELDANTHLPLRRTFQWRNPQFRDFDEEGEEYDDYHTIQGLPTPLTITRYHNGDMSNQRYITKVAYNVPTPAPLFDPAIPLHKK